MASSAAQRRGLSQTLPAARADAPFPGVRRQQPGSYRVPLRPGNFKWESDNKPQPRGSVTSSRPRDYVSYAAVGLRGSRSKPARSESSMPTKGSRWPIGCVPTSTRCAVCRSSPCPATDHVIPTAGFSENQCVGWVASCRRLEFGVWACRGSGSYQGRGRSCRYPKGCESPACAAGGPSRTLTPATCSRSPS